MKTYNSLLPVFKTKCEVSEAEVVEHPPVGALQMWREFEKYLAVIHIRRTTDSLLGCTQSLILVRLSNTVVFV